MEAQRPTWEDFAKALYLVDVYVSIETSKCDKGTLIQASSLAAYDEVYNEPASYIRFVMYPRLMDEAGWNRSDVNVGRGTFIEYYGRRGDIDEFFSQMIEMGADRGTYMDMAAIVEGRPNSFNLATIF